MQHDGSHNKFSKNSYTVTRKNMNHLDKEKTDIRYQKGRYMKTDKDMILPQSPCEWSEHISKSGRKYYFNIRTEISQWEKPQILVEKESVLKARAKMLMTIRRLENNNVNLKDSPSYQNKVPDVIPSLQSTNLAEMINIPLAVEDNIIDSPNSMVTINLQKALHNLHQAIIYSQKSKCITTKKDARPASTKSSISPLESLSSSSPNDFDSIGDPEETFDYQEESNSSNLHESSKNVCNSSSPSTNQIICIKSNQENHAKKLSTSNGDESRSNQVTDEICYAGKDIKLHLCQINVNRNGIPIYEIVNDTPPDSQVLPRKPFPHAEGVDQLLRFGPSTDAPSNNAPIVNSKRLTYYTYTSPVLPGWNNLVNSLHPENIYSKSLYAKDPALTESENVFCKKLLNYFESPLNNNFPVYLTNDSDNEDFTLSSDYILSLNILNIDEQESILQKESVEIEKKANSCFSENINSLCLNYVKSDLEFNTFSMDCGLNEALVTMLDSRLDAIQKHTFNLTDYKSEHFATS